MIDLSQIQHLDDEALASYLKAETKPAWHELDYNRPKLWNDAMKELARSDDVRVRTWVAVQHELPPKVMEALMFKDPEQSVRETAGNNYNGSHKHADALKQQFNDRYATMPLEDREAFLRATAASHVARERDLVAWHPDTPDDVREHLALTDPVSDVRASAAGAILDPDLLDRIIEHENSCTEEQYWDAIDVVGRIAKNSRLPQEYLSTLFYDWELQGRLLWNLASNDNCPSDVLDDMADLPEEDFLMRHNYLYAMEAIAYHANVRQGTVNRLLEHKDTEVVQTVQEKLDFRRTYNLGEPLPDEPETDEAETDVEADADAAAQH